MTLFLMCPPPKRGVSLMADLYRRSAKQAAEDLRRLEDSGRKGSRPDRRDLYASDETSQSLRDEHRD